MCLQIFCFLDLSVPKTGVLKSLRTVVDLYIYPFYSISFASCMLKFCY